MTEEQSGQTPTPESRTPDSATPESATPESTTPESPDVETPEPSVLDAAATADQSPESADAGRSTTSPAGPAVDSCPDPTAADQTPSGPSVQVPDTVGTDAEPHADRESQHAPANAADSSVRIVAHPPAVEPSPTSPMPTAAVLPAPDRKAIGQRQTPPDNATASVNAAAAVGLAPTDQTTQHDAFCGQSDGASGPKRRWAGRTALGVAAGAIGLIALGAVGMAAVGQLGDHDPVKNEQHDAETPGRRNDDRDDNRDDQSNSRNRSEGGRGEGGGGEGGSDRAVPGNRGTRGDRSHDADRDNGADGQRSDRQRSDGRGQHG